MQHDRSWLRVMAHEVSGWTSAGRDHVGRDDLAQAPAPDRLHDELDVREREVPALEQERLIQVTRQRVGEAVAHVEPGRVPGAAPELLVRDPCDPRLLDGERSAVRRWCQRATMSP